MITIVAFYTRSLRSKWLPETNSYKTDKSHKKYFGTGKSLAKTKFFQALPDFTASGINLCQNPVMIF